MEARDGAQRSLFLGGAIFAMGLAQVVILTLTAARVLDPGAATFEIIAVLSELGTAAVMFAAAKYLTWRHSSDKRFALLGVLAGVLSAGAWASLLGADPIVDDVIRVGAVVAGDVLLAIALIATRRLAGNRGALPGLGVVAVATSLRIAVELFVLLLIATATGRGGPNVPLILLAIDVLLGWVVLAIWQIAVGASLLRSRGSPAAVPV